MLKYRVLPGPVGRVFRFFRVKKKFEKSNFFLLLKSTQNRIKRIVNHFFLKKKFEKKINWAGT